MQAERQPIAPQETPNTPSAQPGAVGCSLQRMVRAQSSEVDDKCPDCKELRQHCHCEPDMSEDRGQGCDCPECGGAGDDESGGCCNHCGGDGWA